MLTCIFLQVNPKYACVSKMRLRAVVKYRKAKSNSQLEKRMQMDTLSLVLKKLNAACRDIKVLIEKLLIFLVFNWPLS